MKTNKKFAKMYLSFCKRVAKFSENKAELDSEVEGMEKLTEEPSVANFSKRGNAKLRKFSEELDSATKEAEEIQDSAEELVTEAEATNFSALSKVKILRREFSTIESDLKEMNDEVKEVIEEAASEGQVTTKESTEPAQPGTEQPANTNGVTVSEPVNPPEEGVVEDASAEVTKKVSVNFSKAKYLSSKLKSICSKYKNFSEDFENSGDIIEEITDEVTLEEAPGEKPVETPTEETPAEEVPADDKGFLAEDLEASTDNVAEVAEGIADDVENGEFDEEAALAEVEKKEFSSKKAVIKIIKSFGRVKKHFNDEIDSIKESIDSTATVKPEELTSEEAETLNSEFKTFTDENGDKLTKRLSKKFSNFSKVMKKFSDEEVKTDEVVEAAEDVADTLDATENAPEEFKEFSKKIRKFVKLFSAEAQPTPKEVTSDTPTEEVAVTASEDVVKKDAELNSTLDTINGKIEKLDLPADMTNFAKISSKSLSKIKCFSDKDIEEKLTLIEEFADMCKKFCDKKNMSETPTEENPTEENPTPETPTEEVTTEEVITEEVPESEEFSDEGSDEESEEEVIVDVPVEENTPSESEENPTPENPEEPSESEVVLTNFSRTGRKNNNYGSVMAKLAIMH